VDEVRVVARNRQLVDFIKRVDEGQVEAVLVEEN